MGQIVSLAAKPKRCNLNQLSQVPTPAAGEHILVSSDNSMNAAGQGNFDCYIEGDNVHAATELPLKWIDNYKGDSLSDVLDALLGVEGGTQTNTESATISSAWGTGVLATPIPSGAVITSIKKDGVEMDSTVYATLEDGNGTTQSAQLVTGTNTLPYTIPEGLALIRLRQPNSGEYDFTYTTTTPAIEGRIPAIEDDVADLDGRVDALEEDLSEGIGTSSIQNGAVTIEKLESSLLATSTSPSETPVQLTQDMGDNTRVYYNETYHRLAFNTGTSAYKCGIYPVTAGVTYKTIANGNGSTGYPFVVVAEALVTDTSGYTTYSEVFGTPTASETTQEVIFTPSVNGYAYINYSKISGIKPLTYSEIVTLSKLKAQDDIDKLTEKLYHYAYSFDGQNLYVAYNDWNGMEFTYFFKKCMANDLFTFYQVGFREVTRNTPSVDGISSAAGITIINQTGSDNIGPISLNTGGYVGGNHTYQNGSVKTAKTDSFAVVVDGVELTGSSSGYSLTPIIVKVINTLYDPAFAPASGDTILSTPLSTEKVSYVINKNTIEVGCTEKFSTTTTNTINNWYGMQSMFSGEDYVLTPNGNYAGFTAIASVSSFTKTNYPNFNRFIEKSSTGGYYQSCYLLPFSWGKHGHLGNSADIFSYSSTKCYHRLTTWATDIAGKIAQWTGSYTFFAEPLLEDGAAFAYHGTIRGKDAIFISASASFSGCVPIPQELTLRKVSIVENNGFTDENGDTDFGAGGDGVSVVCTGAASLILVFD